MKQLFPPELLQQSNAAKINYFAAYQISHPKLSECYRSLISAIQDTEPGEIISLIGPTGVGKTTILNRFIREEIGKFEITDEPGHIPIAIVEAIMGDGDFNWKDFYKRVLATLADPIPTRKVNYRDYEALPDDGSTPRLRETDSAAVYRLALEKAISHRGLRTLLIDEAQHLGFTRTGNQTLNQLNRIKSLASTTRTVPVLCGTYELTSFLNLSGQISRRSEEIHFERYQANPSDLKQFREIVQNFQHHLPVPEIPQILQEWEFLYDSTMGCVGVLHRLLLRSLKRVLKQGGPTVTMEILRERALKLPKLERMTEEILNGEAAFTTTAQRMIDFRARLWGRAAAISLTEAMVTPSKGKTEVGVRRAKRDPVGRRIAN